MQQIVTGVKIGNVAIKCPIVDFKFIKAKDNCPRCKYFDGIGLMSYNPNTDLDWSQRFTIRCTHPIERRTAKLRDTK